MKNAEKKEIMNELEGIIWILNQGKENNDLIAIENAQGKLQALANTLRNELKESH